MEKIIDVPNYGQVSFPDTMSDEDIVAAIKKTAMSYKKPKSTLDSVLQGAGDLAAGAVRGAGSIGATLLTPVDALARAVGVENEFIGRRDRRQAMDQGLQELGADPNSMMYKTGKLGGEIAGTAGAGGAVANVLGRAVPVLANAPILQSIASSGMNAGGLGGAAGMAYRALGGATTGGISAGMIDPETAGTGAMFGAALPPMLAGAGKLGSMAKSLITAPKQTDDMISAINAARNQGYVIPPTQANPNLKNRLLEGMAGKLTTAQNASARNQEITNQLAAKSLGLPAETKINQEVLTQVRKIGGDAYKAVANTGMITPSQNYMKALDDIAEPFNKALQGFPNATPSPVLKLVDSLKSPQFDAASAVSKIKELRTAADDAFRTGNTDIARASKQASKVLEDVLEEHISNISKQTPEIEIKNALEKFKADGAHKVFGLRVIDAPSESLKIGDKLQNSFQWRNGNITKRQLLGASTAGITKNSSIEDVLNILGAKGKNGPNGYYYGKNVVLVGGSRANNGKDVGERVIVDPVVLGVWQKPTSGLTSIESNQKNNPEIANLLENFRNARNLIAKTYTVEKALNQVSGSVDARKLASQLQKGKPLTGELRSAAEFASRFPKAAQTVEGMGSLPQTSPLDWAAGAGMSTAMASPLGLLSIGARPAARYAALAPMTQNRLIQGQSGLLQLPEELQQFGYQAMPALMNNFNR